MEDLSALRYTDDVTFHGVPAFLKGNLHIEGTPADTFLRLDGFHKGFVKINGFNLGRYWNDKGPQKTLYVPAPILREGDNEIVVFESEGFEAPQVEFFAEPDLG
jgi:beta-galactosidase